MNYLDEIMRQLDGLRRQVTALQRVDVARANDMYAEWMVSMADDTAYSLFPTSIVGIVMLSGADNANVCFVGSFRAAAVRWMTSLGAGSLISTSTSQLLGTTGTDGRFTVSAYSDGMVYFENRTGSTQRVSIIVFANN